MQVYRLHQVINGKTIELPEEIVNGIKGKEVEVLILFEQDEVPVDEIMKLAEDNPSFSFFKEEAEVYTMRDLKVRYK